MKFTELTLYKNSDQFDNSDGQRNWVDTYALFHILSNILPTKILEIGYLKGFTFSLMYDCLHEHADYFTSCDVTYKLDVASKLLDFKNCEFFQCNSIDLQLDKKYDFIVIDGKHEYHPVIEELELCYRALESGGIIMIDDHTIQCPGVSQATTEFLLTHPDIVPVLIGHQQIFLSSSPIDVSILDSLISNTKLLLSWDNISFNGHLHVPRYRSKLENLIEKFPEVIKKLDNQKK